MLTSRFIEAPLTRALVGMPFDLADAGRLDRIAGIEELVARFERRVAEARLVVDAAADLVGRLRSGQESPSGFERVAAIEMLSAAERNLCDVRKRLSARAEQNEVAASVDAPHLLPLFRRMTVLVHEELIAYLESARDVRWEILALEAEAEPAAEGPGMSTPSDVDDLFGSLPEVA